MDKHARVMHESALETALYLDTHESMFRSVTGMRKLPGAPNHGGSCPQCLQARAGTAHIIVSYIHHLILTSNKYSGCATVAMPTLRIKTNR